ncbi:RecQ family ATP-dependent DNA helicase [Sedimentimonas flavescens]|uniref:RecQ family ATP-dependent DNA helicase n=1 Tax=Sedimentimonas flavescens TaxID=2851012 RepID=UPI001C49D479|nr:RecQ family ATP-dependent DNA helicase [Sedimentimonas flavescens]MBW0159635.1 RecQ family ATP-dependent DNA helicase [Sedimentimonas flavescens]
MGSSNLTLARPDHSQLLLRRCVSIDLEVDPKTATIFALAAVRFGDAPAIVSRKGQLESALDRLEETVVDTDHLIGHNILRHDLPHLAAARQRLAHLGHSIIDTLWLNPLAFPRNPYHHLVKHYHDGRLQAGHVNDPELDARLVFQVLENQLDAFDRLHEEAPDALIAFHYLTMRAPPSAGFDAVFRHIRSASPPSESAAHEAIRRLLAGRACNRRIEQVLGRLTHGQLGWPMAYALSWISVAGGDSVMPPWVRMQFREASLIVRHLRDTRCESPDCTWCREKNDPKRALARWFGFDAFRPAPVDETGRPLQERIVDEAMRGQSILGILPTGTGKSVCYQIPALSKFDKTGALTVVISPLVALMADQVQGMERAGISSAVTINGMLSLPERQNALDQVRMGEAAILLISPEQLRSVSVRSILAQREVGLWVLDEAHCVSKWGHDFRPDYRYIGRFIKEYSGDEPPAPVLCLTATAKPEVVQDIREHFQSRLDLNLMLLDGGAVRTNLTFEVLPTQQETKLTDILDVIEAKLPQDGASGAVVYCATRSATERVAAFLRQQGLSAERFHAGLQPEEKREIQENFRIGKLRVIAATNAFGMGIDKPDIRLVVHGDIPGSLENYLQEAGRAGRDRAHANCVLLFASADVERQFSLSARSRLARHEIGAILRAVRRIGERVDKSGSKAKNGTEVIATAGEIVRAERDMEFERDSATDDTRVKTAVSWLEDAKLLTREENRVQVFPSSLRIRTIGEAEAMIAASTEAITETRRKQLLDIVRHLMNAAPDQGISTDELTGISGLSGGGLTKAMNDLETLGIARNDVAVTVFVHVGVKGQSLQRMAQASQLEADLISKMREAAPDADRNQGIPLHLAETCQSLRDMGHMSVRPDIVDRLLRGMARDGRDQDGGMGNLRLRTASRNTIEVTLNRSWGILEQTAAIRRQAAELLLAHLIGKVHRGIQGKDIQVETTMGDLLASLNGDALLKGAVQDMSKLMSRALLWMHELEVVTLGKGLTVFRPAMTIHLRPGGGGFTQKDFIPLEEHYSEQTIQTHVMAAYAEKGLASMDEALRLSEDYFVLEHETFLKRWLPDRGTEIRRQTTGASWKAIVEVLNNSVQQKIVQDDREQTNVLVLAGPGSGKTRVLVHRIAYLIRVKREDPRGILVLSYNRHAATEIRARLRYLIGDDANGVTVSTCHALAMRLVGASFAGDNAESRDFDGIVMEAVRQLNGEGLSKSEAEAQRETLIQGYRWILVDEYQDIGPEEYALIAAVAGRSLDDPDLRLSLFAVGDDDQNIYAFGGASIRYIRQFEADYRAKPEFLTQNYRSSGHIIDAANAVIAPAAERMKLGHDITINRARRNEPAGGAIAKLDPVGMGRVQLLDCPPAEDAQALAAIEELHRLSCLDPDWSWSRAAIISRDWRRLGAVRSFAEALGIPVEMANESLPSIWRLRETQKFVMAIRQDPARLLGVADLLTMLNAQPRNRWIDLIAEGIAALARELGDKKMPVPDVVEWLAEWSRDVRSEQRGLLLLTAHRAKGLEFDDVVILNGGWDRPSKGEDADAPRRLFYVAMTRARRSLSVITSGRHPYVHAGEDNVLVRKVSPVSKDLPVEAHQYMMPDLKLVDLSWAGRLRDGHLSLEAINSAKVGDPISLVADEDRWLIKDAKGRTLSRMSQAFKPPSPQSFLRGEIGAIVRWRKTDNKEEFRSTIRRDEWESILPELVFS